jgi:purine-cytosine permease-like protein
LSGVVGYKSGSFATIVLIEHFVFRKNNYFTYIIADWDKPDRLPLGIAATVSFIASFGIIIPTMHQAFFTGPIAKAGTGDIGIFTGSLLAGLLYLVLRAWERALSGKTR